MAHLRSQDKVVINLIFQMDAYSQGHLIDILPTTRVISQHIQKGRYKVGVHMCMCLRVQALNCSVVSD